MGLARKLTQAAVFLITNQKLTPDWIFCRILSSYLLEKVAA
jgi:hypothetical protein